MPGTSYPASALNQNAIFIELSYKHIEASQWFTENRGRNQLQYRLSIEMHVAKSLKPKLIQLVTSDGLPKIW